MIRCNKCGIRVTVGSGYSGNDLDGYEHGNCLWEIGGVLGIVADAVLGRDTQHPVCGLEFWFPDEAQVEEMHKETCPPCPGERCPRCFVREAV